MAWPSWLPGCTPYFAYSYVARCRLTSHLPAEIVSACRWASIGVCLRWLFVWFFSPVSPPGVSSRDPPRPCPGSQFCPGNWRWTLDSDFRKLQVMRCNLVTYRLVGSFTCSCWRPVVTFWPGPPEDTRLGAAWVTARGHHSGNDRDDELSGGVACRDSRGVNPHEHPFEQLSWQR